MNNVMIDLETLSTRMDAAILSIGAVRFDSDKIGEKFYTAVTVDSNTERGRHVSGATLAWWMGQSADARAVFTDAQAIHISAALCVLSSFLGPEAIVWGNGANFDISILQHAFEQQGMSVPWKYNNVRCLRTIRNLDGAKECVQVPENTCAHNALADAEWQARWLQNAWRMGIGA